MRRERRILRGRETLAIKVLAAVGVAASCVLFLNGATLAASRGGDFQFAVLSDRTGDAVAGIFEAAVEEVEMLHPDFVMSVGDYIEGYVDDTARIHQEWDEFLGILSTLSVPYYLVPGNHDIWSELSRGIYKERVGEPYYSFDYEKCHFIMIDTSVINDSDEMEQKQVEWLERDLKKHKKARLTFVFYHKPFWFEAMAAGRDDMLHAMFREYGVDYVITGHYHTYCAAEWDGIEYYIAGSSGAAVGEESDLRGKFFNYLWVTVGDDEADVTLVKLGNVLAADHVTFKGLQQIAEIESAAVVVSEISTQENIEKVEGRFDVTLRSFEGASLEGMVLWEAEAWTLEPSSQSYRLDPGREVRLPFTAKLEEKADMYPLPSFQIAYPYGEQNELELDITLNLRRVAICPELANPPELDGMLEGDVWDEIIPVSIFGSPEGGRSGAEAVHFYLGHHDERLYLATWCRESDAAGMVVETGADERDGPLWQEDCVEYFFDTDYDRRSYVQLFIGPEGGILDQLCYISPDGFGFDQEWNGNWEVATYVGEDFWTTEASIAVAELDEAMRDFVRIQEGSERRAITRIGPRLALGVMWGMNLRRKQPRLESNADWQPPFYHDPEAFGRLIFE